MGKSALLNRRRKPDIPLLSPVPWNPAAPTAIDFLARPTPVISARAHETTSSSRNILF